MSDSQSIDSLPRKEAYSQIFSILTNRRQNSEGHNLIGYSEEGLTTVLNRTIDETQKLLNEFNEYLLGLGLSIVEFIYQGEIWYCIKSLYAAPIELNEEELGVLGTLIMLAEENKQDFIEQSTLIEYLTTRKYFNEYRLRKLISRLINSAFIEKKSGGKLAYGPRTLIELNEEVRRQIARQAEDLLF
ncbi:MAG: hypothetical protein ACXAC7_06755 [Candidatus Hodarchaeales archaeon]|jgi:hypothetical protein